MIYVEAVAGKVMEDKRALTHELVKRLADSEFGVEACPQTVQTFTSSDQFPYRECNRCDAHYAIDRNQMRRAFHSPNESLSKIHS